MKTFLSQMGGGQNFIYESMEGGGFINMISISFSGIKMLWLYHRLPLISGERGGSVVECRTPEREVRGSRPTAAVLCP